MYGLDFCYQISNAELSWTSELSKLSSYIKNLVHHDAVVSVYRVFMFVQGVISHNYTVQEVC